MNEQQEIKYFNGELTKDDKMDIFSLGVKFSVKSVFNAGGQFVAAQSQQDGRMAQMAMASPQMSNIILVALGQYLADDENKLPLPFAAQAYFWADAELEQGEQLKPELAKQGRLDVLQEIQEGMAAIRVLQTKLGTEEVMAIVNDIREQQKAAAEPQEKSKIIIPGNF